MRVSKKKGPSRFDAIPDGGWGPQAPYPGFGYEERIDYRQAQLDAGIGDHREVVALDRLTSPEARRTVATMRTKVGQYRRRLRRLAQRERHKG
jgi:hypothetical protein